MATCAAAALKFDTIESREKHDSLIIFLHGSGDSGQGIKDALVDADFIFDKTKIICPTAPFRKYSLLGPNGESI